MHSAYTAFIRARVQGAVATARALSEIRHDLTRGQLREVVVRDLLRPMLPSDVGLGTGEIISHNGRTSRQQDVVMYDRRVLPPVVWESTTGVFPVESVAYTMEIKSVLTHSELVRAHQNAVDLAGFEYIVGEDAGGLPIAGSSPAPVLPILFAFGTALASSPHIIHRYLEISGDGPGLAAICVVGSGYWFRQRDGTWDEMVPNGEFDEVLGILGGIANTYAVALAQRGTPRLGHYFLEGRLQCVPPRA